MLFVLRKHQVRARVRVRDRVRVRVRVRVKVMVRVRVRVRVRASSSSCRDGARPCEERTDRDRGGIGMAAHGEWHGVPAA